MNTLYLPPKVHSWDKLRMDDYVFLNECRNVMLRHPKLPHVQRAALALYNERREMIS